MNNFKLEKDIISNSENDTINIGKLIGNELQNGDWVLIEGNLGSGKTRLVKGIASAYSIPLEDVRSPSYEVIEEYQKDNLTIYHVDLYRFINDELSALDILMYLEEKNGITIIEWSDIIKENITDDYLYIKIEYMYDLDEYTRKLHIETNNTKWEKLFKDLSYENINT